jgi:hypothetical protein
MSPIWHNAAVLTDRLPALLGPAHDPNGRVWPVPTGCGGHHVLSARGDAAADRLDIEVAVAQAPVEYGGHAGQTLSGGDSPRW